jgi:glycine/D-amino acid oxidase-like deaminating enzyme
VRRRDFLSSSGAGLLAGALATTSAATAGDACGSAPGRPSVLVDGVRKPLHLVRARPDRIISLTACVRPFRAAGARVESERLGRKRIVHNYGHGGSGWSLSWGTAEFAVREALATGERSLGVMGCGVIGLTTAIVAQRAGLKVRIYAREQPPDVPSMLATGNWSPASRYCTQAHATPEVERRWEEMARTSFRAFQQLLGLPGGPIEWRQGYSLREDPAAATAPEPLPPVPFTAEPVYADLERFIHDLGPRSEPMAPGTHPFPVSRVRRYDILVFNISAYARLLLDEFRAAGGSLERREFASPAELHALPERVLVNATGYGARALFGDESVIPVRGQLMRLVPQPEVDYGLQYDGRLYMLPRRDGIILQSNAPGDFGSDDTTPDRAAAERTVKLLAGLNARILPAGC